jgi:hypothetical protein
MATMRENEGIGTGGGGTTEGAEHHLGPLGFDASEAITTVSTIAREHPHAALAGAFAVGFLLGGGLTPKMLGAIGMFAARRYFRGAVEETLATMQENFGAQLGNIGNKGM